jgi:hypothetical protein
MGRFSCTYFTVIAPQQSATIASNAPATACTINPVRSSGTHRTPSTRSIGRMNSPMSGGTKTSQVRKRFLRYVAMSVQVSAERSPSLGLR